MTNTFYAGILGVLIGGIVAASLLIHLDRSRTIPSRAPTVAMRSQDVVSASRIRLMDAGGKVRAELTMSADNSPALFFYDSAGRNRMVMGLYSPAEGEAPSVVLNDAEKRAAGIFRLFGSRDTPVIVLKNQGRDRSVYGLNPTSMDPFLANYAGDGKKSDVFGSY